MRKYNIVLIVFLLFLFSCNSTKSPINSNTEIETVSNDRTDISLLDRIRKKGGVVIRNGIPFINRANNTFNVAGNQEPLYILNSQNMGNSFKSINQLVDSFNVNSIEILTGPDAAGYGSQASNGVIIITTN